MATTRVSQSVLHFLGLWAIWLTIALITSLQTYVASVAAGTTQPWGESLINGVLWYSAWAILTPPTLWFARRMAGEPNRVRLIAAHLTAGIACAAAHAVLYTTGNALVFSHAPWAPWSSGLVLIKLTGAFHVNLMIYAILVFIVMRARTVRQLRERDLTAARLEMKLAAAETAALRAQLQPHFLFNTLNAISAVVPDEPIKAQRLIARLGDLLRLSIDAHRGQQSSLADELDFTEAYIAIETARLGERLRVVRTIAPEALPVSVPTLLLQPLVENAVRHGIAPLVRGGELAIEAALDADWLTLVVADNGMGAEPMIEGVGLDNARQRLRHLYGERQSLLVETAPDQGFRVTIRVPR